MCRMEEVTKYANSHLHHRVETCHVGHNPHVIEDVAMTSGELEQEHASYVRVIAPL